MAIPMFTSHIFYAVRILSLLRVRRKCSRIHVALLPFQWYDVFEDPQENEWKCVEIEKWGRRWWMSFKRTAVGQHLSFLLLMKTFMMRRINQHMISRYKEHSSRPTFGDMELLWWSLFVWEWEETSLQDLDSFPIARLDKHINTFENLLICDKKQNSVVLWCGTGREGHCRYDSPTHHSFPIAAGAGGKDFLPEISFYPAVGVLKFPTFTKAWLCKAWLYTEQL